MQVLVVASVAVLGEVHGAIPVNHIGTACSLLTDFVSSLMFDLVSMAVLNVEHECQVVSFEVFCWISCEDQWHDTSEDCTIRGLEDVQSVSPFNSWVGDHLCQEVLFLPSVFGCLVKQGIFKLMEILTSAMELLNRVGLCRIDDLGAGLTKVLCLNNWLWLWLWCWWLWLCLWLWWWWRWFFWAFVAWLDLVDLQWSEPVDSDHTPEALLVHTNESKALKGHGRWIVILTSMHELVRWDPFGKRTSVLPMEAVVLGQALCNLFVSFLVRVLLRGLSDDSWFSPSKC